MPKKEEKTEVTLKSYRSKPEFFTALQYTESADENGKPVFNHDEIEKHFGPIDIAIDNRKIVLQQSRTSFIPGQWLVKDTNGSITCWDDDVFKLTFEEVQMKEVETEEE